MISPDSLPSSSSPSENSSSPSNSPVTDQPWSRAVGSVAVAVFLLVIGGVLVLIALNKPVVISSERSAADAPWFELIEHMKININHASAAEWQAVPGIGPALAGKITEERKSGGLFKSVDELVRVKGIGPRTIDHIREYLVVTEESDRHEVGDMRTSENGE